MHSLELWRNFICGNETGSPGRAVSLHLARSGSQSEHRIRRILPARGACHIINYVNVLSMRRLRLAIQVTVSRSRSCSIRLRINRNGTLDTLNNFLNLTSGYLCQTISHGTNLYFLAVGDRIGKLVLHFHGTK